MMQELPFSKNKQLRKTVMDSQEFKASIESEDHLQLQCEEYLDMLKLRYVHIPTKAYQMLVNSKFRRLVEKISGIPDLLIFLPDGEYNKCLLIELKVKKRKQHQSQKNWAKGVNVRVAQSFEQFKKWVDEFNENK